jgi:hypothetical protein
MATLGPLDVIGYPSVLANRPPIMEPMTDERKWGPKCPECGMPQVPNDQPRSGEHRGDRWKCINDEACLRARDNILTSVTEAD